MREPVRASYRLREFACAHTLRRERCRPSGPTVRPKGARGGACRGPAGPRGRVPVWPSSAPRAGPRAALRGGCARTLHGVRAWGRGRFVPRCRALGRWGPAPRPLFRHFAPGGALGPLGVGGRLPSGSRAGAPAAAGRACPPHGLPVRPGLRCSAGFLAGDRSPLFAAPVPPGLRGGPACSPLRCRGGPWARLGPPPARWCPPSLHRRGARAGCGPRFWARCAPRRGLVLLGLFLCACRCGCRWACAAWRACSARAALAGGNPIQKVLSVGARSERGKFAQGTLSPRLGADSVRLQLRYRKGNSLPQIGQYHQYSLTGYPQKGQRGPSGACTMTTSYSVRFIGHLPLTFPSVCGRILSKSVMSPMARRSLSRCPRLHPLWRLLRIALACCVVPACGGYSFALCHAKIAGHSGIQVNSRKRPHGPLFRRVDNAAFVNRAPPHICGG